METMLSAALMIRPNGFLSMWPLLLLWLRMTSAARATRQPFFKDHHGAEVDIWAVGHLITTCKAHVSENLKLLEYGLCVESATLTARDVHRDTDAFAASVLNDSHS